MSEPIRFHLDEAADARIAAGLRRRDRDCTTSAEANLLSESDESQFAYAVREGRLLIPRDHDFREIAIAAVNHPGVLICKRRTHFGTIIKALDRMASEMTADDIKDQVFYL
jgi:predicted nuclease of predicted toxin-antitoxin system